MRMAEDDGAVHMELGKDAADLLGGGGEARVDVVTALGLACAGEVEGDDVEVGAELLHEGDEGVGAAHEAVQEDERGLMLHRPSLFEVREAKAIELYVTALHHGAGFPYSLLVQLTSGSFGWSIDRWIKFGGLKVMHRSVPIVKDT
jgi:hypothetical protein